MTPYCREGWIPLCGLSSGCIEALIPPLHHLPPPQMNLIPQPLRLALTRNHLIRILTHNLDFTDTLLHSAPDTVTYRFRFTNDRALILIHAQITLQIVICRRISIPILIALVT